MQGRVLRIVVAHFDVEAGADDRHFLVGGEDDVFADRAFLGHAVTMRSNFVGDFQLPSRSCRALATADSSKSPTAANSPLDPRRASCRHSSRHRE